MLNRKPFVDALLDILYYGISSNRFDDALSVLNAVRVLRPNVRHFDAFEANIAMKRGQWRQAIHILRNVEAEAPTWLPAKVSLLQCLYAINDPVWQITANEILQMAPDSEEADFARLTLGLPAESEKIATTAAEVPEIIPPPHTFFLRA